MSTYVYKSFNDKDRPSAVIKGVTFTFGTSPTFSYDRLDLNELVPEVLDRFVDGVKVNNDILVPYTESSIDRYKRGLIDQYTVTQLIDLAAANALLRGVIYLTSDTNTLYIAISSGSYTPLSSSSIVFASPALSASAVVKGVSGDPGNFVGILCTSVAGGKVTVHNAGSAVSPIAGLGSGGTNGLALTAGQYYSLGASVYCNNGIYLEINGTGTYVCLYQ